MSASFTFRYQFECVECGNCCRFPGHVLLTDADIARLAQGLDLPEAEVIDRYTRLASNRKQLSLVDKPEGGCVFLDGDVCGIYAARPAQCRAFPFATTTGEDCPGLSVVLDWG